MVLAHTRAQDLGDEHPLAMLVLGGACLLTRLFDALPFTCAATDAVVVCREDDAPPIAQLVRGRALVVTIASDAGRLTALRTGLRALPQDHRPVLLHAVERALAPSELISSVLTAGAHTSDTGDTPYDAVVPVLDVTDSVKATGGPICVEGATGTAPSHRFSPSQQTAETLRGSDRTVQLVNVDRAGLAVPQGPRLLSAQAAERIANRSADDTDGLRGESFDEIREILRTGGRVVRVPGSYRAFAVRDQLTLWQAQISLGLARDTSGRPGLLRRLRPHG